MAIAILAEIGVIEGKTEWTLENIEVGTQDFMICVEMFFLALAFNYAFGCNTYKSNTGHHVLNELSDMVSTQHVRNIHTNMKPIAIHFADVANVGVIEVLSLT